MNGSASFRGEVRFVKRGKQEQAGFTIVELLLAMSVLLFAMLALSQTLGTAKQLNGVNRETALAHDGIREMLEILQGAEDFSQLFALYNEDPNDDPGGIGTAPGSGFTVNGLDPTDDDADGLVGEIRFPAHVRTGGGSSSGKTSSTTAWECRAT